MRMQEALKESKRETERTKEMNIALEKTKREMEIDLREMQRFLFHVLIHFNIVVINYDH